MVRRVALLLALALAGCGSSSSGGDSPVGEIPHGRPQAIEPAAGDQGLAVAAAGESTVRAPSDAEVRRELKMELVAVRATSTRYINPLAYVTFWGRTDQGVDAAMPVGAPILAPCAVKILAIIPNWWAGQPLVYYELLAGPDAGRIQYVAEQITALATPGSIVQQGQPIARYAASGTMIEFGWSTINGITLARATTGYTEGQVTPAGRSIRAWLNSLGANAGNG